MSRMVQAQNLRKSFADFRSSSFRSRDEKERAGESLLSLFGRGDKTRTCGILLPKQARYQLRHTSIYKNNKILRLSNQYALVALLRCPKCVCSLFASPHFDRGAKIALPASATGGGRALCPKQARYQLRHTSLCIVPALYYTFPVKSREACRVLSYIPPCAIWQVVIYYFCQTNYNIETKDFPKGFLHPFFGIPLFVNLVNMQIPTRWCAG